MPVKAWHLARGGVKVIPAGALIEEEARGRGSDEVILTFQSGQLEVQEVA